MATAHHTARNGARVTALGIVIVLVIFAFPSATSLGTGIEPLSDADPVRSAVTFTDISAEQESMIVWALDLYEQAGLQLPGLDFVGYPDTTSCAGRAGAARRVVDRTEIRLCTPKTGPVQEWLVLHELAHAWDHQSLDDTRRQAFLDLRELPAWRDGDWHDRGAEHAAEIMVWGLMDRPVKPGHIDHNSCEELRAGYVTLTDDEPLHGYTDACE